MEIFLTNILISLLQAWQKTRPFRAALNFSHCRFYPSCSNYFLDAIKTFGEIKGFYLSFKRIFKCNPLFEGGIDRVK